MKPGNILTLSFKSKKGKERLKRDGAENWVVKSVVTSVQFSSKKGPWLLINKKSKITSRWIHATSDIDFTIIMVK